jgi:Ca2+-binding RTX toxin-like protein
MTTRVFRGITYTVDPVTGDGNTVQGTQGNDWIEASGSNNVISTGKGNDVVLAGVQFSSIGNYPPLGGDAIFFNYIPGIAGNGIIDTGAGDDYVVVEHGSYTIDLGDGNNVFEDNGTSIHISAGNGNDIISAQSGLGGEYQIDVGGGNNWVYLGPGKASVSAGSGNDVITTGLGAVFGYFFSAGSEDPSLGQPYKQVFDAGNGDNQIGLFVYGKASITTGSGKDFVLTSSFSSIFTGEANSDTADILTGSGDDTIITIGTKSLIKTGEGDDLIVAGDGDDTIYAGSGRNVINLRGDTVPISTSLNRLGWFGSQVQVQGGGNDTLYLESGKSKVILGSSGSVTIYGFDRNDLLDVSGLNATFARQGDDTLIKSGSTSLGVLKGYTGPVGTV